MKHQDTIEDQRVLLKFNQEKLKALEGECKLLQRADERRTLDICLLMKEVFPDGIPVRQDRSVFLGKRNDSKASQAGQKYDPEMPENYEVPWPASASMKARANATQVSSLISELRGNKSRAK